MARNRADFVEEMGGRTYALLNLGCFFGVVGIFAAVTLLIPGVIDHAKWWVIFWIAAGTLTLAVLAANLGPLLLRGGAYRVVAQDGWLRVDSPHRCLGPSFAVALTAIARLVISKNSDSPDRYEVCTASGQNFEVNHVCGERVFEAIRRLRPEIPVELR